MSYTRKTGLGYLIRASNAFDTAENLAAAGAVYGEYYVTKPCSVSELRFIVSTTLACETTAPVIKIKRRPTPGSDTGAEDICSMTIPDLTAAGKVCVERFAPVQLNVGDSLTFQHVTQGAGAAAAGAGFYDVVLEIDEESDANQSDLVVVS
jgi:hypothetical protein